METLWKYVLPTRLKKEKRSAGTLPVSLLHGATVPLNVEGVLQFGSKFSVEPKVCAPEQLFLVRELCFVQRLKVLCHLCEAMAPSSWPSKVCGCHQDPGSCNLLGHMLRTPSNKLVILFNDGSWSKLIETFGFALYNALISWRDANPRCHTFTTSSLILCKVIVLKAESGGPLSVSQLDDFN